MVERRKEGKEERRENFSLFSLTYFYFMIGVKWENPQTEQTSARLFSWLCCPDWVHRAEPVNAPEIHCLDSFPTGPVPSLCDFLFLLPSLSPCRRRESFSSETRRWCREETSCRHHWSSPETLLLLGIAWLHLSTCSWAQFPLHSN